MSWAYGAHRSDRFGWRDVGYGVDAECDYTGCTTAIDRGLDYRCGGQDLGGPYGCGDYFCHEHLYPSARRPQRCPWCCRYSTRRVAEIRQQRAERRARRAEAP